MNFENFDSKMIMLGNFNARTGVSEDSVELENEQIDIPYRSYRDKITNTNERCLLDVCKTTEMSIVNGRIGSDKKIGDFTCVTHEGRRLIDYFLYNNSSLNLIQDLIVPNFDDCLSELHCAVVIEKIGSKEFSSDNAAAKPKLRKT